jgi:Cu/Ag efflux pump CusA
MNKRQKLFVGFLVLFLVVFMSASCIQDAIVPVFIEPDLMAMHNATPANYLYTTLFDAKRLQKNITHKLEYQKLVARQGNEDLNISIAAGEDIKNTVFNPSGPLALMFPALAGLGLGRYIKSPREKELEKTAKA